MRKTEIANKMSSVFHKAGFKLQKHSPEILVVSGIIGVVVSAVLACKATTKVSKILEESKKNIDDIHECEANETLESVYSVEDVKKDLTLVYIQTGIKFIKLYAPAVMLGVISITSILASNNILRKRNIALSAAYTAVDKAFKEYRKRVVENEKFGKDVDKELKYGIKAKKIKDSSTDPETGKEVKTEKTVFVVNPSDISEFARFFEQYTTDEEGNTIVNHNWDPNNEYNLMFIKAQERYANDLLKAKKRLFLNEVYEMLGLPRSKAGQIVGWVYDPEDTSRDNYVDFGLYQDNLSYSDFVNGYDPAILLDFNVDGNIWDLM